MGIGWIIYFSYSIRHAALHRDPIGRFAEVHAKSNFKEEDTYPIQDYNYHREHA